MEPGGFCTASGPPRLGTVLPSLERAAPALRASVYPGRIARIFGVRDGRRRTHYLSRLTAVVVQEGSQDRSRKRTAPTRPPSPRKLRRKDHSRFVASPAASTVRR